MLKARNEGATAAGDGTDSIGQFSMSEEGITVLVFYSIESKDLYSTQLHMCKAKLKER